MGEKIDILFFGVSGLLTKGEGVVLLAHPPWPGLNSRGERGGVGRIPQMGEEALVLSAPAGMGEGSRVRLRRGRGM